MLPVPADERPHPPGPGRDWEESWHFDFVAHDGSLGGFVRLVLRPGEGTAWYWAYLAGFHRPVVVVRDHELDLPPRLRGPNAVAARTLELRGPGLWAQLICETPLDHWSAGLEAAGVALDDPAEGLRGERGDPVPLGLDLEWEATGAPAAEGAGYAQPAAVHGEVLLGSQRLDVEARGWWAHRWGAPPWRADGWWWAAGNLDDGTALAAGLRGPNATAGMRGPKATAGSSAAPFTLSRSGMAPTSPATLAGGGAEVTLTPAAWAVVPLPGPRGLARALCSWSAGDNRGWGWCEWLQALAP